jgi:hypothetical protein
MLRASIGCLLALVIACGPTDPIEEPDDNTDPGLSETDADGDGVSPAEGDCNDTNAAVNPFALDDTCDGLDNDCNGIIDDPFNADGDGFSTCSGDCDDGDGTTFPGATEEADGLDNDCDGIADNNRSDYDDDGDGWSEDQGDCNDDEPLVNPGAVEVDQVLDSNTNQMVPELVDNNCNGAVDEGQTVCGGGLDPANSMHLAQSIELCNWVTNATVNSDADIDARNIVGGFGSVYAPMAGPDMLVLSSGLAGDASHPSFVNPNGGTMFGNTASHPDPQGDPSDGCGTADPSMVNDYIELDLELQVPTNALSLSYDFNFVSAEFPEWVCTSYDDTFSAVLESQSFTGNISFDDQGRPVTINVGFFDVCMTSQGGACTGDAELAGTGYEGTVGGGTGWLTTTAPVTPGETIHLRFIIFDEGDSRYDSTVLIDNFRWEAQGVDEPITVERVIGEPTAPRTGRAIH